MRGVHRDGIVRSFALVGLFVGEIGSAIEKMKPARNNHQALTKAIGRAMEPA